MCFLIIVKFILQILGGAGRRQRPVEEIRSDFIAALGSMERPVATNTPEEAEPLQDVAPESAPVMSPPAGVKKDEELSEAVSDAELGQDFDWAAFQEETSNYFNNPNLKKAILSRANDLNIDDVTSFESVVQTYTIIPNRLIVELRSLTGTEDMAIKDIVSGLEGSYRFVIDMNAFYNLAAAVKSVNNTELVPVHTSQDSGILSVDQDALKKRTKILMSLPMAILGLISVTYLWFDETVREKLIEEVLGKS